MTGCGQCPKFLVAITAGTTNLLLLTTKQTNTNL